MNDLQDRITRVEERLRSERERTDIYLGDLYHRMRKLEVSLTAGPSWGLLKVLAAVCFAVLGFMMTGDPRAALSAAKLGLGAP